jgi:hypothetical protein
MTTTSLLSESRRLVTSSSNALRGVSLAVLCVVSLHAHAAIDYRFETVVNGADPASMPPWMTASFETVSPGMVNLTIELHREITSEFVTELALNLNPSVTTQAPQFQQTSGTPFSSILFAEDAISLTGGGSAGRGFDISISWPRGEEDRFDLLETATFLISGPPGLVAEDFDVANAAGIFAGAHIQGSGGDQHFSGVISGTKVIPSRLQALCGFWGS